MSVPRLVALAAALTVLAVPATASAATSTFDRLEVIGSADFRNLSEVCDDGRRRPRAASASPAATRRRPRTASRRSTATTYTLQIPVPAARGSSRSRRTTPTSRGRRRCRPRASSVRSRRRRGRRISVDIAWEGTGPLRGQPQQHLVPGQIRRASSGGTRRGGDRVKSCSTARRYVEQLRRRTR